MADADEGGHVQYPPFPTSLCHRCDAPPRYIRSKTSTFIYCPRLPVKYPPQPVLSCTGFRQRSEQTQH
jgi:hypothetical protein